MIGMLRKFFGAAAVLALSACASAAPETPEAPAFAPALFVARDADSTIYLYGTIHLRRPGGDWAGENTKAALAEADELWTEMLIGPESDAIVRQIVQSRGFSPEQPLSSRMSAEEYARFAEVSQSLGVPAASLDQMRPWLASLTISLLPMMQAGYDPEAGVDAAVNNAAGAGVRRRAFETAEQQIGFFADLDDVAQLQLLHEAVANASEGAGALDELSIAWERGDLATLERVVIDEFQAEAPDVYEIIFVRRNHVWVETLMGELAGSGVDFVAVGAGHMLGDDGLVALLRARGVTVERVR